MNKVKAILWGVLYTLMFYVIVPVLTLFDALVETFPTKDWGFFKEAYGLSYEVWSQDKESFGEYIKSLWEGD